MTDPKSLDLLKSLRLLDQLPEEQVAQFGEFLKLREFPDAAVVFEEASRGESLYFIAGGHVRISKRMAGESFKDLAILGPGDSFGEMAVLEPQPRSARASAVGALSLFELHREDLQRWLKSHPELAMGFFAHLVQVQSRRLRRTSSELTLLFDLSSLLLEPSTSGKQLVDKVLVRTLPHLPGAWSAAGYLYNMFNEEMDRAASRGDFDFSSLTAKFPPASETRNLWLDDASYYVSLPGPQRPQGFLLFRAPAALPEDERNEIGRTLTTVARLLTSALENINFRNEENLRDRLTRTSNRYGSSI